MSESPALSHQETTTQSLEKTISNPLWLGYEELKRTMGFSKKKTTEPQVQNSHFITPELEHFDKKLAEKRK